MRVRLVLLFFLASCPSASRLRDGAAAPQSAAPASIHVCVDSHGLKLRGAALTGWADASRSVAFFTTDLACFEGVTDSVESDIRGGGCGCTSDGIVTGLLRVGVDHGNIEVAALCGSIWMPTWTEPIRTGAPLTEDVARVTRQIVEHGWPSRCPKADANESGG